MNYTKEELELYDICEKYNKEIADFILNKIMPFYEEMTSKILKDKRLDSKEMHFFDYIFEELKLKSVALLKNNLIMNEIKLQNYKVERNSNGNLFLNIYKPRKKNQEGQIMESHILKKALEEKTKKIRGFDD